MGRAKVAITLDRATLDELDRLIEERIFPNRSQAIEQAVAEKLERIDHGRLKRECGKLDPSYERALAEEGISEDVDEWPEY